MSTLPLIFDRPLIRSRRDKAAAAIDDYNFLMKWTQDRLLDRRQDIKRTFSNGLCIGTRVIPEGISDHMICVDTSKALLGRAQNPVVAEDDFLPFADNSFDLVFSNFSLHTVNDLPGALIQINRVLKPDGVMLAAMPGGGTLHELRDSLAHAEVSLHGGLSPRVAPFTSKQDMASLLQRGQFTLPVVDSERVIVTYKSLKALVRDLRGMGENNYMSRVKKPYAGKAFFALAEEHYRQHHSDPDGRIRATFEIILMIGWKHHDSQQQPLKPGSADLRLSDALDTEEIATRAEAKP